MSEVEIPLPPAHAEEWIKVEPQTLVWRATLDDGSPVVFKVYRHRRVFQAPPLRFGKLRVCREHDALLRLERREVPCTKPSFWAHGESPEHGRFELLATRAIGGAVPVRDWIDGARETERTSALSGAFRSVRAMHACGVRHGALSFKNLLVTPDDHPPRVFLADFARAILFPSDIAGTRMAWFDLADLSRKVIDRFGTEVCLPLLASYGLDRQQARRLMGFAQSCRSTRQLRRRLRLEFRVRAALAERPRARAEPSSVEAGPPLGEDLVTPPAPTSP